MIKRESYLTKISQTLGETDKILFLIGARQVGKTSLIKSLEEFGYISNNESLRLYGDDLALKNIISAGDIVSIATRSKDLKSIKYLIIDEAQLINNIGSILKSLIDKVRRGEYQFKIIVSGSGSLGIFKGMTDSLIGRKDVIQVYPFNFEEFLLSKGMIIDKNPINLSYYQPYWEEYITYGGYPQVVLATSHDQKTELFVNLYKDYLFRDISLLLKEKEFHHFSRFIELIASKVTSQCNISSLCEEFGAKRKVIEKYLFVLENTFVIKLIDPYVGGNIKREVKKYQKIYFHDTGMLRYILGVNKRSGSEIGKIIENFVCTQLTNKLHPTQTLHYWSIAQGEIDFIIKDDFTQQINCIEVKQQKNNNISKTISNFIEHYHDRIDQCIITTSQAVTSRQIHNKTVEFVPYIFI